MGTAEVVEIHTIGQGLWNLYTVLNGLKFKVPQCMGCEIFEYVNIYMDEYISYSIRYFKYILLK